MCFYVLMSNNSLFVFLVTGRRLVRGVSDRGSKTSEEGGGVGEG